MKLPKKITPCPLIDTIVEIRFDSDLLPDAIFGIIYKEVKEDYPKLQKLPILNVPDVIRLEEPDFKYQPHYQFIHEKFVLQIGPKMLAVSSPGEYVGWEIFLNKIMETYSIIKRLEIISKVTRLGIRYINFFNFDIFDQINLKVSMNDAPLKSEQTMLRSKSQDGKFMNLLQILNKATIKGEKEIRKGSIIDIDTHLDEEIKNFFNEIRDLLVEGHEVEKTLFFSLIKDEYLQTLNPEY